MAKTRRSADVLSGLDPSQLYVNLLSSSSAGAASMTVPMAFPVSPSHSSSDPSSGWSNSGGSDEDEAEEESSTHAAVESFPPQEEAEPFLATLVSDPLYIHGQMILLLEQEEEEKRLQTARILAHQQKENHDHGPDYYEQVRTHTMTTAHGHHHQ
jgi:hypothetical protein